jgi:hypothetical protein
MRNLRLIQPTVLCCRRSYAWRIPPSTSRRHIGSRRAIIACASGTAAQGFGAVGHG